VPAAGPVTVVSAGVGRGFLVHPAKITAMLRSAKHSFREIEFMYDARSE
jgi:hypothetical protein